ncbi:hypothetical protein NEISICOT_00179 [Neisseria sicca ATCC 29256]|uniref:Uncharacterized protein n=1 Tax=Neisseria sicca ATCC 29256 TaxID=547045 RepID=C6M102_NEISI|nr:hypothetical protein NEISICOT_00179 [Neisseria sicca ATCC 29256]
MHFSPCEFRYWLIVRRLSNRPTTQNHSLINYQHALLYRTYVFSTQTQSQIICLFRRPVRRILSPHNTYSNKRSSENIVDKIAMIRRCQRPYALPVHGGRCRLVSFLF